jgi:hypothetical protein
MSILFAGQALPPLLTDVGKLQRLAVSTPIAVNVSVPIVTIFTWTHRADQAVLVFSTFIAGIGGFTGVR